MKNVNRRKFLKIAGAGGAAATVAACGEQPAAPAIVEASPRLSWRLTSSFPKSLDTIYGTAEVFARTIREASDGRFTIQVLAAGEIVGPLQAADAVSDGTVEAAHTASYYYWGKDPTFALGTCVPFGLNSRMQNAWMYEGGGIDLMNEFYQRYNIFGLPGGNTGAQMGGWYRKEINTPEDWKGLKIRIGGFGGAIMSRLGAVPQQIAGGDIYPSLEKGTIDAAEWVGPYDDEKLGFYRVAPHYYYPGWWEGQAMLHFFINLQKWNELPKSYQAIVRSAAQTANTVMMARYDMLNPGALRRLVKAGAILKPFSESVLDACFKASNDAYAEISAANPQFKKTYEAMTAVRAEEYLWFQLSEHTSDTYMMIQQRKNAL
ncbi:TRAP transporter substrate-binding protein [Hyphomicrobium sp. LHD-15]|uniref:TRAP transporter substrate-binding protein n=1 Tax=Hyphomicrobium sp. LHD-15 TaxID=3072142 RepID=UPI00280D2721|nr:TRAP transporter substrate-binding protein [Hyphomicrobium sp. LHD-15]MDQ8698768.1 TRAP transporter substrate-binding protein [Hyphomicrobium sp. LHD-15]